MTRNLRTLAAVIVAAFFIVPRAAGQNIVEYFGKEKITSTSEGSILHTFRTGYQLPVMGSVGSLFTEQDIMGWLYATGNFKTPVEGEKIEYTYPADPGSGMGDMMRRGLARREGGPSYEFKPVWTWSAISADDTTDVFSTPDMRWSYLYTEYNSTREQIVLLDATGGTRTFINGMPHEGDHYDFGYTLIPVKLKKGKNQFVYTSGRFGRVASKLVAPSKPVMFTPRDMTLPDIIIGEADDKWGAVRVINATEKEMKGLKIEAILPSGERTSCLPGDIMPMSVRKMKFSIPSGKGTVTEQIRATLVLSDGKGKEIDRMEIDLQRRPGNVHHERTFVSEIDGSVQYYSVAPSTSSDPGQAFVLSVHGAAVEARSQARAYAQKDWCYVVAATNRRPFGFTWEEWGRVDALEVLEIGKKMFKTAPEKTYLTGHSMGGHGSWVLGTTYPDKFAAIAPCASYPDLGGYGRRTSDGPHGDNPHFKQIARSANAGRIPALFRNLIQSGVYIYHGDADQVVSIEPIRKVRAELATFHPNFCYYEYPGGSHWFGNESIDWKPIFDYFKWQTIPENKEVKEIEFHTATPVVSASDYWIKVEQQEVPFDFTTIKAKVSGDTVIISQADNAVFLTIDIPSLKIEGAPLIQIGSSLLSVSGSVPADLRSLGDGRWEVSGAIDTKEKYSLRGGGFKHAFGHNVVFVYATGGTKAENEWYMNRARFDAETFYYRGNGSMDIVADRDFRASDYPDRNVMIYGNASNNSAWGQLLAHAPFSVANGRIDWGGKTVSGDDLAAFLIYPRNDSPIASVGVVAGTGDKGMRAAYANNYFLTLPGFPDYMIFRADLLREGLDKMELAGFFDNKWQIK